jgi:para-aminobenzoate synthetase/4-amino-4-deoxychorismate lyase
MIVTFASEGAYWRLDSPVEIVSAHSISHILPALCAIERATADRGLLAFGFVAYEAAPAFDRALRTHPSPAGAPLLRFGLFAHPPRRIALPPPPPFAAPDWRPAINREQYCRAFQSIKEHIGAGRTYQVNFTYRFEAAWTHDPFALFCALVAAQPSRYACCIEDDDMAICSASPELFFSLDNQRLRTRPMKGTIARGLRLADDLDQARALRASVKNRAENLMIVDMIRNDMGRVSETGSVAPRRLFGVERYPTLWQMTSTVESRTPVSTAGCFSALFPCASITGAPKIETMRIITELERSPRGVYTGALGWIAPGRRTRFSVAIRTVTIDKKRGLATYGAGGGVVSDSEAGAELDESRLKARILLDPPPSFSLLETILWRPDSGWFLLEEHIKRMRDSARYFGFRCNPRGIRDLCERRAAGFDRAPMRVRLILDSDGDVRIEHAPAVLDNTTLLLAIAKNPVDSADPLLYHKTTRRDIYERARRSVESGDDVILYNERDECTETAIGNIVARFAGEYVTPHWRAGLLPGVFRQSLLSEGRIREQRLPLDMLRRADSLWRINSVRAWQPARLIEPDGAR